MAGKVKVEPKVLEQLLLVRDTGQTNMFDFNNVQRIAYELDCYELVSWMEDNKSDYASLIMYGADEA